MRSVSALRRRLISRHRAPCRDDMAGLSGPGLFGRQLGGLEAFLPPDTTSTSSGAIERVAIGAEALHEINWVINDYEGALAEANRENKPVLIDFTGYTCTNCRWMEANMFSRPAVSQELKRYICVRLYTDGDGEIFQHQQHLQQEKFGTVALPFYAILRADGSVSHTFPGLTQKANLSFSPSLRRTKEADRARPRSTPICVAT